MNAPTKKAPIQVTPPLVELQDRFGRTIRTLEDVIDLYSRFILPFIAATNLPAVNPPEGPELPPEALSKQVFALPMHHVLSDDHFRTLGEALNKVASAYRA